MLGLLIRERKNVIFEGNGGGGGGRVGNNQKTFLHSEKKSKNK